MNPTDVYIIKDIKAVQRGGRSPKHEAANCSRPPTLLKEKFTKRTQIGARGIMTGRPAPDPVLRGQLKDAIQNDKRCALRLKEDRRSIGGGSVTWSDIFSKVTPLHCDKQCIRAFLYVSENSQRPYVS